MVDTKSERLILLLTNYKFVTPAGHLHREKEEVCTSDIFRSPKWKFDPFVMFAVSQPCLERDFLPSS